MKERKIIFAGLDYVGKTSIILTLQKKFSSMNSIPTKGIARSNLSYTKFLGFEFTTWDLGGQEKFRKGYMKSKYRVFTHTEFLFYVIDMQDPNRFDLSMDYFKDILHTLETLNENPKISILFHKDDPDIKQEEDMQNKIDLITSKIEKLEIPFKYKFFKTSIHERGSIVTAFSRTVLKGEAKAKLIKERLKEYAKNTFSSAVVLFTPDYLEMASHYTKKEYLNICESVAPHFIDAMSRLTFYELTPHNTTVDLEFNNPDKTCEDENSKEQAIIFVKSFKVGEQKFHVLSLTRNKRTIKLSEEYLPFLSDHLGNLLSEIQ